MSIRAAYGCAVKLRVDQSLARRTAVNRLGSGDRRRATSRLVQGSEKRQGRGSIPLSLARDLSRRSVELTPLSQAKGLPHSRKSAAAASARNAVVLSDPSAANYDADDVADPHPTSLATPHSNASATTAVPLRKWNVYRQR